MYIEDENINSKANFRSLRKECYALQNEMGVYEISQKYPNMATIAGEFKASVDMTDLSNAALIFGKNQKINFIKHVREIKQLSLIDAKFIADGYWQRNGWEKKY